MGIAKAATSVVNQFVETGRVPQQQQQPQNQPGYGSYTPPAQVGADDFVTGRDFAAAQQTWQQQFAPQIEQSTNLAASANLGLIRQQQSEVFQKYGPEINARLATVPRNLWTLENLTTVVNLVKADHVEELARERAQRFIADMDPTLMRSSGGAGAAPISPQPNNEFSLQSEKIPQEWKDAAARAGITERIVEEFCRSADMEPRDFYEQFSKSAIITEAVRRG